MSINDALKSSLLKLFFCVFLGMMLWLVKPDALTEAGYHVLVVFIVVLVSFFLRPYPMGLMVMMGLLVLSITHSIHFKETLEGFSHPVVWLVIAAFMLARCIIDSGLGKRIALLIIHRLASSETKVAYGICLSELILGPLVASNTARGGGVLSPIVSNMVNALGLTPEKDSDRIGEFLFLTGAQANLITAAMFLTGMAANPLASAYAKEFLNVSFGWLTWAKGAIVPGLVSLFLLPLFLKLIVRPKSRDMKAVVASSAEALKALGPISQHEKIMGVVFLLLLTLWSLSFLHGLSTVYVAWIGVMVLLISHTLSWESFTKNTQAWDTMIWLGGLITMATALKEEGVIKWLIQLISLDFFHGFSPLWALLLLAMIYFYSMYGFSMLTAHISAFLGGLFVLCAKLNTPPMVTVAMLCYFSNLCACLTHYSTGPVVIYFSYGYVTIHRWFVVGFLMSLYHLVIWGGLGLLWWHYLGWWS